MMAAPTAWYRAVAAQTKVLRPTYSPEGSFIPQATRRTGALGNRARAGSTFRLVQSNRAAMPAAET